MLSPDGQCRAFSDGANGYVRSEGGGSCILKRHSDAVRDGDFIHGIIRGLMVRQDGRSASLVAPNGKAQESLIRDSLHAAGVSPEDVKYIQAHGTGTSLGDPIEINAIQKVFNKSGAWGGKAGVHVGSVKANVGHLETAAGMLGLIATILALRDNIAPPNRHLEPGRLNPKMTLKQDGLLFAVNREVLEDCSISGNACSNTGNIKYGGLIGTVSSFGYSGTIAHIVIEVVPGNIAPIASGPYSLATFVASDSHIENISPLLQFREYLVPSDSPMRTTSPKCMYTTYIHEKLMSVWLSPIISNTAVISMDVCLMAMMLALLYDIARESNHSILQLDSIRLYKHHISSISQLLEQYRLKSGAVDCNCKLMCSVSETCGIKRGSAVNIYGSHTIESTSGVLYGARSNMPQKRAGQGKKPEMKFLLLACHMNSSTGDMKSLALSSFDVFQCIRESLTTAPCQKEHEKIPPSTTAWMSIEPSTTCTCTCTDIKSDSGSNSIPIKICVSGLLREKLQKHKDECFTNIHSECSSTNSFQNRQNRQFVLESVRSAVADVASLDGNMVEFLDGKFDSIPLLDCLWNECPDGVTVGLDSLSGIAVVQALSLKFQQTMKTVPLSLSFHTLFQYRSVSDVTEYIWKLLNSNENRNVGDAVSEDESENDDVNSISSQISNHDPKSKSASLFYNFFCDELHPEHADSVKPQAR